MAEKPLQSLTIQGLSGTYVNTPLSTAPVFDNTTTYAVGDYVFYNRKLYKFTSAHSAGNWDSAHVSEITIGSELKNLKDESVTDVQVDGTSAVSNGVVNIPVATASTLGVLKVPLAGGLFPENGSIYINGATEAHIKQGNQSFYPITPNREHSATFYGLAKAAGDATQASSSNAVGTYTEDAKSKIHEMLDAPVTVSGTTPTITGKAGIRYICGEVSTLSITTPASGDMEVIFESGSTATVLTVPNTVKFPAWFDATDLEANCTYDIIITNGTLGVVTSWA